MYINKQKQHLDNVLKWKSDGIREKTELKWYSSDSKENFETYVKSEHPKIYDWFKDNPIEYKFNNHGFRTPDDFKLGTEFTEGDEGIAYLGCSHTAGVGTSWDDLWVSAVHQSFPNQKCINLGVPAASPGTCLRLLLYYKKVLKINKVFHYSLLAPRYEFIYDTRNNRRYWDYFGAYLEELKENNKKFPYDNYILNSFLTNEYRMIDQVKNFMAIRHICDELGITYILVTEKMLKEWEGKKEHTERTEHYIKKNGLTFVPSRDGVHMNAKKHYILAQYFNFLNIDDKSTQINFDICGF